MIKQWLIVLFAVVFILTGCVVNPITGQEELMFIPEDQDAVMGRKYAPEVEKQMGGIIDDTDLQNYINTVGKRVASFSHRADIEYTFAAVNDKSINAFALPGGYIFITRGMLEKLSSEAQLAAIFGHEIVHVVARDSSAAISREIGISILLAAVVNQDTPDGAIRVADLTRQMLGFSYSRQDERDADFAGLDYMVRAGYDPQAMVETMQILANEHKTEPIEFFSTHPSTQNRIEYIQDDIDSEYAGLQGRRTGKADYKRLVLNYLSDNPSPP